jgi:hypothetical protein
MQLLSGLKLDSRELRKSEIDINRFRQQIRIVYIMLWITLSIIFLFMTVFRKTKENNSIFTTVSNVSSFARKVLWLQ